MTDNNAGRFIDSAKRVGANVVQMDSVQEAVKFISEQVKGITLVPETVLARQYELRSRLAEAGADVFSGRFRDAGQLPWAGVTFSNFCLADSGTVVLESTNEEVRLATTLPEVHFVLVDPKTILEDNLAAVEPMIALHKGSDPVFVAYITGPSRTADIERVLTIGCHGPRELHIIMVEGISSNVMEN